MKKKLLLFISFLMAFVGVVLIIFEPLKSRVIIPNQIKETHRSDLMVDAKEMQMNLDRLSNENQKNLFDYGSVRTLTAKDSVPKGNPENVIGIIYVPSVDMELPIKYGVTDENLQNAAGTMKPAQIMGEGNYVLVGHNHFNPNVLFAPIRKIKQHDSIYITDKNQVYEYTMFTSKVVRPEEVEVINDIEGKDILTLISCYSDDGSDRIIVQAVFKDVYEYSDF